METQNDQTTQATQPRIERPSDLLTSSMAVWNNSEELEPIGLQDPKRNVLASYDVVPETLEIGGHPTEYCMLKTTDEGLPVGVPFKPSTYNVLDNKGFIDLISQLCDGLDRLGMKYSLATTGTLRGRGRVFIALAIDGMTEYAVGNRVFNSFLNCLNSVDKSCAVTFSNNTFCVCCANTFSKALTGEDSPFHAKVRHTKNMNVVLSDIPLLVEAWISGNEAIFNKLQAFESFGMSLTQAENTFAAFLAGEKPEAILKIRNLNLIDKLKGLFSHGKGNNGETMLDVFSAVTDFYSHESAGKTKDPFKQMESSEIGDGQTRKVSFFSLLSEMADKTERFDGICKVGEHVLIASNKARKEALEAKAK